MIRSVFWLVLGVASGCSDDSCGTFTANLPSQDRSYDSFETCSATFGTFGADRGSTVEILLAPDSGFPLITSVTAMLAVDTLAAGQEQSVLLGTIVGGTAMWHDGSDFVDRVGISSGFFRVESAEGTDSRGNALFRATWDLRWGDPSNAGATWYQHAATDTIKIQPDS